MTAVLYGDGSYLESVIGMRFWDASSWSLPETVAFVALVALAYEFLGWIVPLLFSGASRIEARGKHHDTLDWKDVSFMAFNRVASVPFTYHFLKAAWLLPFMKWRGSEMNLVNTVAAVPLLYIIYDLFYTLLHRFLHHQRVYKYIHKHHHRQHAPSRGNLDAINVHPIEFVLGEYNHLLAVYLTGLLLNDVHVSAALVFIVAGGVAASLNHTRYDVRLPPGIYDVRVHDVHHRMPKSNYGQYCMLWDRVMGSFRPYDETAGSAARAKVTKEQ